MSESVPTYSFDGEGIYQMYGTTGDYVRTNDYKELQKRLAYEVAKTMNLERRLFDCESSLFAHSTQGYVEKYGSPYELPDSLCACATGLCEQPSLGCCRNKRPDNLNGTAP